MRLRSLPALSLILLSLGLAACDQTESANTNTPPAEPPAAEPMPIPARAARGLRQASAPREAAPAREARPARAARTARTGRAAREAAPARPPVTELRGSRVAAGERALGDRGYTRVRSAGNNAFWRAGNRCVRTTTGNGRYSAVATVNASACRR